MVAIAKNGKMGIAIDRIVQTVKTTSQGSTKMASTGIPSNIKGIKKEALTAAINYSNDLLKQYNALTSENLAKYQQVLTSAHLSKLKSLQAKHISQWKDWFSVSGTKYLYPDRKETFVLFFTKPRDKYVEGRLDSAVAAMDKRIQSYVDSFMKQLAAYAKADIAAAEKKKKEAVAKKEEKKETVTEKKEEVKQQTGVTEEELRLKIEAEAAKVYNDIYAKLAAANPGASAQQISQAAYDASMDYGEEQVVNTADGQGWLGPLLVGAAILAFSAMG